MSHEALAYPRPDRDRSDRWLSLDGPWEFSSDAGVGTIEVPFAWETQRSGVGRTWMERGTYRRAVRIPVQWTDARVFLCFGAVHHRADVSCNGTHLTTHVGGSTPFEVELTDIVGPGQEAQIVVDVEAPADKRSIPHGKQRSIPRDDYDGVCFTPTSGIWQSVWLEARGRTFVSDLRLAGESLTGFDLDLRLRGDVPALAPVVVSVLDSGHAVAATRLQPDANGRAVGRLEIPEPRTWSPQHPHLYSVEVVVGEGRVADRVTLTGGLRRVEVSGEELRLNGERLYVRGVLDQGYWPDTGLTAPSLQALVEDLHLARSLGFTLVRKHLKLEDPRWLHEADRTGMLVWAEPPSPSRFTPESTEAFLGQLAPMVARDANHPCIVVWGLYNEEWGLDWDIAGSPERADAARTAYEALKKLDTSRPVVENSGWAHVRTDLVDWHYYDDDPASWAATVAGLVSGERGDFPVKLAPDFVVDKPVYGGHESPRPVVPMLNSEYGGGFTSLERAWHLRWQTQELRRHDRLSGYVYTELTDVEHEMAGVLDAERRLKDLGGLRVRDVHGETVLVVDIVPATAGADIPLPDGPLPVPVHVSHHGRGGITGNVHAAWVPAGAPFDDVPEPCVTSGTVTAEPFRLSAATTLVVPPLGRRAAARLLLWLTDATGTVRARTFVDAGPIEAPNRRGARGA